MMITTKAGSKGFSFERIGVRRVEKVSLKAIENSWAGAVAQNVLLARPSGLVILFCLSHFLHQTRVTRKQG